MITRQCEIEEKERKKNRRWLETKEREDAMSPI